MTQPKTVTLVLTDNEAIHLLYRLEGVGVRLANKPSIPTIVRARDVNDAILDKLDEAMRKDR